MSSIATRLYYILDPVTHETRPGAMDDAVRQFNDNDLRRVAEDTVNDIWVSTVFLVIDHNLYPTGIPILFETMTFPREGAMDGWADYQDRYATWDQAKAGHDLIVAAIKAGKKADDL